MVVEPAPCVLHKHVDYLTVTAGGKQLVFFFFTRGSVVVYSVFEREGLGINESFRAKTPESQSEEGFNHAAFPDQEVDCSDLGL